MDDYKGGPFPLALARFIQKYQLPVSAWSAVPDFDAYELVLGSRDIIRVSGPTLMYYED